MHSVSDKQALNGHLGRATPQVLTFSLHGESYGVDILRVKEIRGWSDLTHLPNLPDHIVGVLSLRGAVLPVVDLRMRFGLASTDITAATVIVVLSINDAAAPQEYGVVVDGVSDVTNIAMSEVKDAPCFGGDTDAGFVRGLIKTGDRLLILLNACALIDRRGLGEPAAAIGAA